MRWAGHVARMGEGGNNNNNNNNNNNINNIWDFGMKARRKHTTRNT
jgi:hypothetical protein